jgi:tetratricopeptide (TPR) repeat protein
MSPHDNAARLPWTVRLVRLSMEVIVLALVVLSPWAMGAVQPQFELYLHAGVAILLALWGARLLLEWQWSWKKCPVALCLAILFLSGMVQLIPLPQSLLAHLSPATAHLYQELLPSSSESPAGATLSLYPGATRSDAVRLLAVFLLFIVVRNNLASVGALRRLSLVALANGLLLALFALVQFFAAPRHTLYWTYASEGEIFGPFICRNHFAFYANLCVGLGIGLMLGCQRQRRTGRDASAWEDDAQPGGWRALLRGLHEPRVLWIQAALALVLSSVACSMSRGGVLALFAAGLLCLLCKLALERRWSRWESGLVLVCLTLGLVSWFGMDRVQERLATLWSGEALQEGRLASWLRVLPLAEEFPVWGTGLGTYAHVEPLQRGPGDDPTLVWDHAHNEYLEALIEGGIIRLMVSLVAIGLVFRLGFRAMRQQRGREGGALALGAMLSFATIVIHSAGEFGLHVPAIAFLATVLSAQLCGLAQPSRSRSHQRASTTWRMRGLVPLAGAAALSLLGLVLWTEGRRADRAERFRQAATRLGNNPDPTARQKQLTYLDAAVRITPENAALHVQYAEAAFNVYKAESAKRASEGGLREAVQAVLALGGLAVPGAGAEPALALLTTRLMPAIAEKERTKEETRPLVSQFLQPAVREYTRARDLCPLLPQPHLRLAANVEQVENTEPRDVHLNRAKLVRPSDAEVWYLAGAQAWLEGRAESATEDWRCSLACSDRYFREMLVLVRGRLEPRAIVGFLPDNPHLLFAAAEIIPDRRPFLEKALSLLDRQAEPLKAEDLYLRGQICRQLDRPKEALASCHAAVVQEPRQVAWRYDYAELLVQQGRWNEAREELNALLGLDGNHAQARTLLNQVSQALTESR